MRFLAILRPAKGEIRVCRFRACPGGPVEDCFSPLTWSSAKLVSSNDVLGSDTPLGEPYAEAAGPAADLECFALTAADFCLSARLFLQNSRFPFGLFPPLVVLFCFYLTDGGRRGSGFGARGSCLVSKLP